MTISSPAISYAVHALWLSITLSSALAGPTAAPGGSACPQPAATLFSMDADIPSQKLALMKLYSETTNMTFITSGNDTSPQEVGALTGEVFSGIAAAAAQGSCRAVVDLAMMSTIPIPNSPPYVSYCQWLGVVCCISGTGFTIRYCEQGPQSVSMIFMPDFRLTGTFPDIFDDLPDLQFLILNDNPGLKGELPPMSVAGAQKMQLLQIANTSITQYSACSTLPSHTPAHPNECLPGWLKADTSRVTVPISSAGMLCPALEFNRSDLPELTYVKLFFEYAPETAARVLPARSFVPALGPLTPITLISTAPSLYGFIGCKCLAGYVGTVGFDSQGTRLLKCAEPPQPQNAGQVVMIASVASFGGLLVVAAGLGLCFRSSLVADLERRRINHIKRRHKPGLLSEAQQQLLGVGKEVTLVLTDIAGSTAIWEWNARVMDAAVALHDTIIRNTMYKNYGHEVYTEGDSFTGAYHEAQDAIHFVLELQLELLKAQWPVGLAQCPLLAHKHQADPLGKDVQAPTFAGLRVRAAVHSGIPAAIEEHATTGQLSYHGSFAELTEAISNLPAGGQTLLSNHTFQLASNQLHKKTAMPDLQFPKGSKWLYGVVAKMQEPAKLPFLCLGKQPAQPQDLESIDVNGATISRPDSQMPLMTATAAAGLSTAAFVDTGKPNDLALDGLAVLRRGAAPPEQEDDALVLDMGEFLFEDFWSTELGLDRLPGSAALKGINLMQILPSSLRSRAAQFAALPSMHQVSPSFFDSPASASADFMQAPENTARHPLVTIAFCSLSKLSPAAEVPGRSSALSTFRSCVRTSLLLSGGVECQEKDGTFMIAFTGVRIAMEWALSLQMCLHRLPCSPDIAASGACSNVPTNTTQLFAPTYLAKIGIAEGPVSKVCPHKATGRADYFGQCVNRAARLQGAASMGETVLDHTAMEEALQACEVNAAPEAAHHPLALRNCHRLSRLYQGYRGSSDLPTGLQSPSGGGDTGSQANELEGRHPVVRRTCSTSEAAAAVLELAQSYNSPSQAAWEGPFRTRIVPIIARVKGTYALKGIAGHPILSALMPKEIEGPVQSASSPRLRTHQRGKAVRMVPAPLDLPPQHLDNQLLDIYNLAMLPVGVSPVKSSVDAVSCSTPSCLQSQTFRIASSRSSFTTDAQTDSRAGWLQRHKSKNCK
ncbi:hypothetical protein WJX74_008778 [Apatococcus lobatus]|uniref:Guanylate cyclase domain-containing protein n=1 Tax=Apatococcus lobatus TaxID=904363 RepID=A0AAW1SAX0_9CHLO